MRKNLRAAYEAWQQHRPARPAASCGTDGTTLYGAGSLRPAPGRHSQRPDGSGHMVTPIRPVWATTWPPATLRSPWPICPHCGRWVRPGHPHDHKEDNP